MRTSMMITTATPTNRATTARAFILACAAVLVVSASATPARAQGTLVRKGAQELAERMVQRGGSTAARELTEIGGEAAVREVLEKATREGGEKLATRVAR